MCRKEEKHARRTSSFAFSTSIPQKEEIHGKTSSPSLGRHGNFPYPRLSVSQFSRAGMRPNISSIYPQSINCTSDANVRRLVRWVHPTCSSETQLILFHERFLGRLNTLLLTRVLVVRAAGDLCESRWPEMPIRRQNP